MVNKVMLMRLIYWAESQISQTRNTNASVVASRPIGQEVNADKTKYMVISRDQNAARKSHTIKNDNTFFEKEEQLNTWKQPKRIILVFIKKLRAV